MMELSPKKASLSGKNTSVCVKITQKFAAFNHFCAKIATFFTLNTTFFPCFCDEKVKLGHLGNAVS